MVEIVIIAIDAIIPTMPTDSFDWNKDVEPMNTAAESILPES